MIGQALLDFFRDILENWLAGIDNMVSSIGIDSAAAAIAGAAGDAGHFLALFIGPSVWGAVLSAFGAYVTVWLATGLIAVISRRGMAS